MRGPRVLAALIVGAALATAGAAYQGLFRNPLVSPDILGVASGAALGAVVGIYLSLGVLAIQALAFAGGLVAVMVVWTLGSAFRAHDPVLVLVLAGLVVGTLAGAGVSLLKYMADPYNQLPAITFWLLGSLAAVTRGDVRAVLPGRGAGPGAALAPALAAQRDDARRGRGARARRGHATHARARDRGRATLVTAGGRLGERHRSAGSAARARTSPGCSSAPTSRRLLPASMLIGAGYLLAVDTLARTIAPVEVPLGVLTALVGAPFFVWLAGRGRGEAWQ